MAIASRIDLKRLEDLRNRFDRVAFEHPNVDAVVVYRLDLRREESERQARQVVADPRSHDAIRCALQWDEWIPPSRGMIEQLGIQKYWERIFPDYEAPEAGAKPIWIDRWRCTLLGPPSRDRDPAASRLFKLLASDAASLALATDNPPGEGRLMQWLVHLADRSDPIILNARRQFLHWSRIGGMMWIPVTSQNPPTRWWAVRLPSVFYLSQLAIELAIGLATPAPVDAPRQVLALTIPLEGDDWDALEPQVRQLLRYMRERESADLRDLCPVVWGKEYLTDNGVTEAARETATSKANGFLRKRQAPRFLEKIRREPILRWA